MRDVVHQKAVTTKNIFKVKRAEELSENYSSGLIIRHFQKTLKPESDK